MIPKMPQFLASAEEGGGNGHHSLLAAEEKRAVVTPTVAAKLLGKSSDTIYRWLNEGRLAGRRVGGRWMVYRDSVEQEWRQGLVEPSGQG